MTMALRKGEMSRTVATPVMALPYQSISLPGSTWWMKGRKKVNISAMTAAERME